MLSREMNAKAEYGWQPCRERSGRTEKWMRKARDERKIREMSG